jgi:hypothetical protein
VKSLCRAAQSTDALSKRVGRHLATAPYQQKVTDVLLDLRFGEK